VPVSVSVSVPDETAEAFLERSRVLACPLEPQRRKEREEAAKMSFCVSFAIELGVLRVFAVPKRLRSEVQIENVVTLISSRV
jgi:hypothetical protein